MSESCEAPAIPTETAAQRNSTRLVMLLVRFPSGPIDYFHLVSENRPHDTAIYSQSCSVCRRRELASQVDRHRRDFIHGGKALQQGRWPYMLKELLLYLCLRFVFLLRHRLDKGAHAFRLRRPGKNAVHRHARTGHRLSDPARNGNLRSLGHAVVHHFCRNLNPRFARYEKNPTPVPFQHPCEIVSREPHSAHHVYLEEAVPVRIGNLGKRLGLENAYVVYEYIYHGKFRNHGLCAG